jgi:hypothetical protein
LLHKLVRKAQERRESSVRWYRDSCEYIRPLKRLWRRRSRPFSMNFEPPLFRNRWCLNALAAKFMGSQADRCRDSLGDWSRQHQDPSQKNRFLRGPTRTMIVLENGQMGGLVPFWKRLTKLGRLLTWPFRRVFVVSQVGHHCQNCWSRNAAFGTPETAGCVALFPCSRMCCLISLFRHRFNADGALLRPTLGSGCLNT